MPQWVSPLLGLVAAALVVRLIAEWRRYQRREHIISGRQLALRAGSGLLLVAVLAMMALGVNLEFTSARSAAAYWGVCLLLVGAAIALAMLDLWQVAKYARRRRAEMYQRMSSYLEQVVRRRDTDRAGDQ